MMLFKYFANVDLPPLAWLASTKANTSECYVEHGRLVEVREGFFVEGVWPGGFADGGFDRCESFFGSGAVRRSSGEIMFVPSSATVDYLYYKGTVDGVICSNSLPFLLAAIGSRLDEFCHDHIRINDSILKGIERYEQRFTTRHGDVRRLMYHNLVVKDGVVRQEAKPLPPEFESFERYRSYFGSSIAGIMKNARERTRNTPLRILSTQSTGYDTTATNSVARDYSLDLALSIDESKERQGYFKRGRERRPSDSGEEIGRFLGIETRLIDRRYFLEDPASEYLYWAGLHSNQDLNLHQVREYVDGGAVLLTGSLGEVWENAASTLAEGRLAKVNDQLEKGDLSCNSLSEVRLHIGYVHAPAPYIGGRSRKSLFDLANSEAMRPWSIGGTYDKPIPRRLGEEAGVPRDRFGQRKLATVVEFLPPYLPYGALLRREFFRFFRRERGILCLTQLRLAPAINSLMLKFLPIRKRFASNSFVKRINSVPIAWLTTKSDGSIVPGFGDRWKGVLYAYCVNKTVRFYEATRSTEFPRQRTSTVSGSGGCRREADFSA